MTTRYGRNVSSRWEVAGNGGGAHRHGSRDNTVLLDGRNTVGVREVANYRSFMDTTADNGNSGLVWHPPSVSVLLVEDHGVVREGTRELLEQEEGIEVIGEAASAEEALDLIRLRVPDVMIVDIQLPGMNGIELVQAVAGTAPRVRCLMLSAYDDYVYASEALDAGACGYLLKTVSVGELIGAVHAVASGATVLDDAISRRLTKRWRRYERPPADDLTPRELDVVRMLARGNSNKEIASELGLGLRTVESYVSNILSKFGVRSRTEAALYAINHHLVSAESASL